MHRSIINWEWYKDIPTRLVFEHLIYTANFKDTNWKGIEIKRGQVITGRKQLADDNGLTERKVRTALEKLQSTGEITIETTNKYSLITIVNYDFYQSELSTATNKPTNNRPTDDQQPTNNRPQRNNDNNLIMEERKKDSLDQTDNFSPSGLVPYPQSDAEVREYCEAEGLYTDPERFYSVNDAAGWKDKSGAQIRDWKALCRGPVWNVRPADPVQEQHTRVDQETKANSLSYELWFRYTDLEEDGEIGECPIPPTSMEEMLKCYEDYSGYGPLVTEFYNYFNSKGWKVCGWKIRDWKLAFLIWLRFKNGGLEAKQIEQRMDNEKFSSIDSMFFCTEEERNKIKEKLDWRAIAAR